LIFFSSLLGSALNLIVVMLKPYKRLWADLDDPKINQESCEGSAENIEVMGAKMPKK